MNRGGARARLLGALAVLAAVAAGAGLGLLVPRFGAHLGGGWERSALAAGGLALAALFLARLGSIALHDRLGAVLRIALGPTLFAGAFYLGWIAVWGHGSEEAIEFVGFFLQAMAPAPGTLGVAALGAIVGLGVVAFVDPDEEAAPFAGAAFGAVPGLFLGDMGGWSSDRWFAAPVAGALVALLLAQSGLWASRIRHGQGHDRKDHLLESYGASILGAALGTLLVGGSPHAVSWARGALDVGWIASGVRDVALDLLDSPAAAARVLGFEAGWVTGAVTGAILGLLCAMRRWWLVTLLAGAALGFADWFASGRILTPLFEGWRPGALTGALAGAAIAGFREGEGVQVPIGAAAALVAGGLAHGLAAWTGGGTWVHAAAGAAVGLFVAALGRGS